MGHNDHCLYEHSKKKITWKVCQKCERLGACPYSVPDPDDEPEHHTANVTVRYQYKCRRCGKIKQNAESSIKIGHQSLLEAIYSTPLHPNVGAPRLGLMETHSCKDGGMGIADLTGYEIIQ